MEKTKYEVCLDLVNSILRTIGYEEIEELTDFKNVKREDLIKPEVMELIEEKEKDIFPPFDKMQCRYYNRKKRKNYEIVLLKHMVRDLELNFESQIKAKSVGYVTTKYIVYNIFK